MFPPPRVRGLARRQRGSVLIVALLLASIIGISLVSYIKLCTNSLNLAHRTLFANTAANLVEAGLEEAVWSFNQMGGGVATATAWNGWTTDTTKVVAISVTKGGSGYTSAPTVTLSGGGGSGAAATATISNGAVTSVSLTNLGSGYTSAPTVAFSGGSGSGATATATNVAARRDVLSSLALDQNATATVKVFVAGYDGSYSSPVVVAQATITPFDGGTPIVKITQITLKFNGPFVNGVVAKNGIDWNGHPTADSWISNPTNSATGPWAAYSSAGARSNTTVADLTGTVSLGSGGVVQGNLALGSAVSYGGSGSVSGPISYNFSYTFTMPTYPTASSLDNYYNLGSSIPASLPRVIDSPNTADGRYYYFAVGANFGTTISANRNVTIVGSGSTNITGTVTIPSGSSLIVYTDGTINGTFVNNAWAGALQLFTSTTSGTTLNGNDNIMACIFAPNSAITGNGGGSSGAFYGSFIGSTVRSNGHMDFHYDESLARIASSKPWALTVWRELQTSTERASYTLQLSF